jgi:methylmalonyl-CoA/ethylmalonyl-CoA epimerase
MFPVERIDHICVAVKDLEQAKPIWEKLLSKEKPDLEYVDDPEAINVARYYVGEVGYELMESTREGSDIDRFIKKRGEGIMLISFKVPDADIALEGLKEAGFQMIDQKTRCWNKSRFAFIHPGYMNGVLVEIID